MIRLRRASWCSDTLQLQRLAFCILGPHSDLQCEEEAGGKDGKVVHAARVRRTGWGCDILLGCGQS